MEAFEARVNGDNQIMDTHPTIGGEAWLGGHFIPASFGVVNDHVFTYALTHKNYIMVGECVKGCGRCV